MQRYQKLLQIYKHLFRTWVLTITSQGEFASGTDAVKKMSNVKTPVNAKNDKCLEVGTGNNTNGEIGITIKTDGLCKQVWELPGLVDVKALIESTTDNKTANTLKFGGMGIKYKF